MSYISKEQLASKLRRLLDTDTSPEFRAGVSAALGRVQSMPRAKVIKPVRCRNCGYNVKGHCQQHFCEVRGEWYCWQGYYPETEK